MSAIQIIFLSLQGLIFVAWAFMMFRTLFRFRRRSVDQTGLMFPSTSNFITQAKYWLSSPKDRVERHILLALTIALIALNLLFYLTAR
ncbi:hypothetical protein K3728_18290 [Rhodobacteraceae bacterium M385]|nr:hypothetical protein K3728_18290 [Rhodobacteraceae bacterium M385]